MLPYVAIANLYSWHMTNGCFLWPIFWLAKCQHSAAEWLDSSASTHNGLVHSVPWWWRWVSSQMTGEDLF